MKKHSQRATDLVANPSLRIADSVAKALHLSRVSQRTANQKSMKLENRGLSWQSFPEILSVPDHDGGSRKWINAWFLNTHMVYL